ncbi:MAG: allantoinase AllB, partial [Rhodothermales bacterium]|nr:allantoinase AllB [Rhodothermales bacterium]
DELRPLADAGVFGFKAFMIDSGVPEFAAVGERDLRTAMSVIANTGLPLLVHAETDAAPVPAPGPPNRYASWLASRPRRWENHAISVAIRLGEELGCPVHIVHLSSSDALVLLRRARARGTAVTVETCPHYLYFAAEDIADGDTLLKCAPPIREHETRERLWEALHGGLIDMVVSDHSPSPPEMKELSSGNFLKAWGGISSLQLGLSAVWTEVRARGAAIEDVSRWMSAAPSRLVGLYGRKGVIRPGADADLVVFDPDASFQVEASTLRNRHALSPYVGRELWGQVKMTFVRGHRVVRDDGAAADPRGRVLTRRSLDGS